MLCFFFAYGEIASNTETTGDVKNDDWLHRNDSYQPMQIEKENIGTILFMYSYEVSPGVWPHFKIKSNILCRWLLSGECIQ
jgi:hypothetical protein